MKVTIEGTDKEIAAFLFGAEKRQDSRRLTDEAHVDVCLTMLDYASGTISLEEYRDRLAAVLKQDCSWQKEDTA